MLGSYSEDTPTADLDPAKFTSQDQIRFIGTARSLKPTLDAPTFRWADTCWARFGTLQPSPTCVGPITPTLALVLKLTCGCEEMGRFQYSPSDDGFVLDFAKCDVFQRPTPSAHCKEQRTHHTH